MRKVLDALNGEDGRTIKYQVDVILILSSTFISVDFRRMPTGFNFAARRIANFGFMHY